jgi:hypothetical protein
MSAKLSAWFRSRYAEYLLLGMVLAVSTVAHGYNMFGFPYYENDEGTYLSQAWSLLTRGKLSPYTYWYDHAPAGWIFTAAWILISGGIFSFGFSLNSGRVLMLIIHLLSSCLLFQHRQTALRQISGGDYQCPLFFPFSFGNLFSAPAAAG